MWQRLQHFAAQQTTPLEVAVFLVLVTVLCMLAAAAIYAGIMTAAWLVALRGRGLAWRRVVFPDFELAKRFRMEYALAGLTSVILALTLVEKDRVVDSVLALPPTSVDSALLANLTPLHRSPVVAFAGTVAADEVRLGDLVRTPLNNGRSGEVREVFVDAVRGVLKANPALHAWLARWLPLACVLVILGYLTWFSGHRIGDLGRIPKGAAACVESPYRDVLERLSVLGVCIGLLLVSPTFATDAGQLAESAVAAARQQPSSPLAIHVDSIERAEFKRQFLFVNTGTVDTLVRHQLAAVIAELDTLTAGLHGGDSVATQVAALRTRLDGVDRQLGSIGELGSRFDAFDRRLLLLGGRVDTVITRLRAQEALSARGLVVVETDVGREFAVYPTATSQAGAAGRARANSAGAAAMGRGNSLGVFWLAPGDYTVRADRLPAKTFSVSAGIALAISMRPNAVGGETVR